MFQRAGILYADLPNEAHVVCVDKEHFVRNAHSGHHFSPSMDEYVHVRQSEEIVTGEDADLARAFGGEPIFEYGSGAAEFHSIRGPAQELEKTAVFELEIVVGEVDHI